MKKVFKSIFTTSCIALVVVGCGSSKNVLRTEALQGEWNIIEVEGKKAVTERTAFLGLDITEKTLYGCAGCNRIMGEVIADEKKPGHLSFGRVSTSRMICPDMETEMAVISALHATRRYTGTEESLVLTDEKGDSLMVLSKAPESSLEQLDGTWDITHVKEVRIEDLGEIEKQPYLTFHAEKKTIGGHAGCNNINGEILQEDGQAASMKFHKMISTMMSGPGLEVEVHVLEALNSVTHFKIKDADTASLYDDNGQEVITLQRRKQ